MWRKEEHKIYAEGLRLKGFFYNREKVRRQKGTAPLLVLCHGIPAAPPAQSGSKGEEDGGYPALAAACLREGFLVFHFNFRGTGESEGNFDLAGWERDLEAVLDYGESELGKNFFLIWGFSAGAAVSCCVAARDPRVKALVMAASPAEFTSIFPEGEQDRLLALMRQRGIIRDVGFPGDPCRWLQGIHGVNPLKHIGAIAPRPLLIIHGDRDELIPREHACRLYRAAGAGAQLVVLPGAGHQLRRYPPAVNYCLLWLKNLTAR